MADRPIVTGMFHDPEHADRAYRSLRERGYNEDDVHVVMSKDTRKKYYDRDEVEIEHGSKAMEGAGAGAAIGGTTGGILGALAAAGTAVALPGLGLAIAGPIAGALAGAGAGGAAGSLVGALIGAGIPEDRAKVYEKGVKEGGIVVGAHPRDRDDAEVLARDFETHGGREVYY
ncbi:MAG: hypothetical protein R3362_02675 [Rhodothermales bacterium]|nr:hypothetical protein [Rhodothermales bacterium]